MNIKSLLLEILENRNLESLFQPIVVLKQYQIIGYHASIQGPVDTVLQSSAALYEAADHYQLSVRLQQIALATIIENYAKFKLSQKLFLNVNLSFLSELDFKIEHIVDHIDRCGLDHHEIVIILSSLPHHDYKLILEKVTCLRNQEFKIGLYDLDTSYSSIRQWSELLPDFVIINKHIIQALPDDLCNLNFIRLLQTLAHGMNCHLLAEGVDHQHQIDNLTELAVSAAYGYYFAEPTSAPSLHTPLNFPPIHINHLLPPLGATTTITIEGICRRMPHIESNTKVKATLKFLQKFNDQDIFPVLNNTIPVGLISKNSFLSHVFSSNYGLDLFGHKPITEFLEENPLIVESSLSIEEVSQLLTSNAYFNKAFVVTHRGNYLGVGVILDLLQAMTHLQIQNAQHANPLTLLPGSHALNSMMDRLLSKNQLFTVAYFDLDNFKPYNDIYGYSQGDEIIKLVAKLLKKHVIPSTSHIGHIGGDDFIVIFTTEEWQACCERILQEFSNRVLKYYHAEHRQSRTISSHNRQGELCTFPLLSLSIGIVSTEAVKFCHSHVDIADLASEAKHQAKLQEGNSFFVNRRIKARF